MSEKIAIIIPVFNKWEFTRQCLASLSETCAGLHPEIIIIDNNSTDQTKEMLNQKQFPLLKLHVLRNKSNIGCAKAWNQGLKFCQKTGFNWYLISNNDIVFGRNWLTNLIDVTRLKKGFCYYPSFTYGPFPNHFNEIAARVNASHPNYIISSDFAGWCFMLNRECIEKLGYFDEQFEMYWYEDVDYFQRLMHANQPPIKVLSSYIHHYESATLKQIKKRQIVNRNRMLFQKKWGPNIRIGCKDFNQIKR